MTLHTLKVSGSAARASIELNGVDIAECVTGLRLDFQVGYIPTATLDLALVDVTPVNSEQTEVLLGEGTRDLLVRLGWTPPAAR